MYVHAYQSYVWNAIVSERIKTYGVEKPIVGDLVFDVDSPTKVAEIEEQDNAELPSEEGSFFLRLHQQNKSNSGLDDESQQKPSRKGGRKPWVAPKVKTLAAEDLENYTIFDVIMPLPGIDVAFPGGSLGERYKEFLIADGLDPNNFVRKQK